MFVYAPYWYDAFHLVV